MVTILLTIVILHFVIGVGWLMYKLSPRKGEGEEE